MPLPFISTKRVLALAALLILGALFFVLAFGRREMPYSKLKIGMPAAEVQALFGGPPTYVFEVKGHKVWYIAEPFRRQPPFFFSLSKAQRYKGQQVEFPSLAALPDLYDWVQVLFDREDRVWAFCHIGECYFVEYPGGQVKGSHLKFVSEAFEKMATPVD